MKNNYKKKEVINQTINHQEVLKQVPGNVKLINMIFSFLSTNLRFVNYVRQTDWYRKWEMLEWEVQSGRRNGTRKNSTKNDKWTDLDIQMIIWWQIYCPYKGMSVIILHSVAVIKVYSWTSAVCQQPFHPKLSLKHTLNVMVSLFYKGEKTPNIVFKVLKTQNG